MTKMNWGSHRLLVDVEATRAYYAAHGELREGCGCLYCRNFAAAVETLPPEVETFLKPLGLDLYRPGDASECGPAEGGRLYLAIYHVVGRLLETGKELLEPVPGVSVWFAADTGPFLRDFPEPFFQCCLSMTLPWVLNEPEP